MFKINYYFCETNSWIGLFFDSIIREITNKKYRYGNNTSLWDATHR